MGWFTKKVAPAEPKRLPSGFFSTDFSPVTGDRDAYLSNSIAKSIQRTAKDFKPVNDSGVAMDDSGGNQADIITAKAAGGYIESIPLAQFGWYAAQGFIGYQTSAIIAQHWLVDKACAMPGKDAVRHGYDVTVNDGTDIDPKIIDRIRKLDKKFRVKSNCFELVHKGRIFGIRIAMFSVNSPDPRYYENPFNADGVTPGSYKGIIQIDPYWISPELNLVSASNPASPEFYEPTWWRIAGKRVHKSHLVIFRTGNLPDILKPSYLYGGIPLPQKIAERVYAAERTANEAPILAMSKRLTVINVDIAAAMANQNAFKEKMDYWAELRDNYGIKVIGETETLEQFDTSLADMDALIMTQYQLVAAIAGVPATKLLGTTPKGFNATGEYEESSYHEELESIQEHDLTPLVDRHHALLIRSEICPKFNIAPFHTEINWKPVDSPTAQELADLNLKKSQTDNTLVQAGAIDGTDVRERIIKDPDSGYNGIPDVVPGGPGDREAEQDMKKQLSGLNDGDNEEKTGLDEAVGIFDPATGMLDGARIITHQWFLDDAKVDEKIAANDFVVHVTPEFINDGKRYRMMIDGHHSLAAAMKAKVQPEFTTDFPRAAVFNAVTRQATDGAEND